MPINTSPSNFTVPSMRKKDSSLGFLPLKIEQKAWTIYISQADHDFLHLHFHCIWQQSSYNIGRRVGRREEEEWYSSSINSTNIYWVYNKNYSRNLGNAPEQNGQTNLWRIFVASSDN